MPAGTWNLGRLRKRADYVGLKDLGISLIDKTVNSDSYFNITEFPNQLTGGKNLFKLNASANTLVKNSKIHIEVLDSNGNPLYYEPINYLEADGTRVIAIYVYPEAPYGTATVYVAGRARVDQNGNTLRVSQNVNDPDYINFPNVIWSRSVTCAPERRNSTEIIFTQQPSITLQEVVQPYLQPVNLSNVATQSFGTGTCTIKPKPASVTRNNFSFTGQAPAVQGSGTRNSPPSYFGNQIAANPASVQLVTRGPGSIGTSGPTSGTTTTIVTALDESIFETSTPFFTSDMGQGDVITVVNPLIQVPEFTIGNSENQALPASQAGFQSGISGDGSAIVGTVNGGGGGTLNGLVPLSGSYNFVIDLILNSKKAQVVLLESPAGFKNIQDANTGGRFEAIVLKKTPEFLNEQGVDDELVPIFETQPTANYTCSFTLPFVVNITEQSQSFAEIKISNIEPATGDVYKLKTFYKAGGQFGDFIDAGETVLEQVEILEDELNLEANALDGVQYNRMGFFSSLDDYGTYFTSSQGIVDPTVDITETFEPDDLLSGIRLTPASNYGPNDFSYIRLKDEYRPKLSKNTQYLMTVNLFADNSFSSTDPNVSSYPQLDIYVRNISGSTGKFNNDENTVNAYIKQQFGSTNTIQGYDASLTGIFDSDATFGVRIGSVQVVDSGSIVPAIFKFESLDEQRAEFYFVQRNGRYNIGNISVKTFNESAFTPNFTKINTRIPSQFIKTPLTFKLLFYDYLNQQAEAEAILYPVTFTGENTVHEGDNNIITGTMTVGNTVGAGIELVGQNSAYIRSIGYDGFISASRTETQGGFLMYTGSIQITGSNGVGDTDNYKGVGLELVEHSESFLRFATQEVSGLAPGLEIRTPKFFLGSKEAGNFISGSNGNIEITSSNFHLDRDGDVVLQGTITAEAGGTIGGFSIGSASLSTTSFTISSSQNTSDPASFISSSNFKVSAGGTITGSSVLLGSKGSGNYLEFDDDTLTVQGNITVDNIRTPATIGGSPSTTANASSSINSDGFARFASASIAGFEVIDSEIKSTSENLRLKSSGQITGSQVLFAGGKIGGWTLSNRDFQSIDTNGGIAINSNDKLIRISSGSTVGTTILSIGQIGTNKFGISGKDTSGNEIFKLGEDGNEIAGWTITDTTLAGGQMIINKNGTIESAGFASNVAGSGFRLTADQGGFLEVENARIRGTLSTAVFEKEAVNAVGGQLYVANSSVLTGSAVAPNGVHTATTTTMSLENVSGFASGEILTAKKVSETGFATEYLLVNSSSRFDKSSDTDFAGYIYVTRGYSGSAGTNHNSSSLGDLASNAQSYSGSQVIVSTGKIGTGYIRLNANPNDPYTPYIDIVERTGSAIYDIDLKARLGDLSGLSQARLHGTDPANAGFGLYSQNVFLEGGIVARTGSIAGIEMESGKLYTGDGQHSNVNTGFYIDSGSNFSLGDKLTWDGNALTVRGQIQLTDGTDISSGTDGAPSRTISISTNATAMAFDDAADTSATPEKIIFSVNQQNLATKITGSNITITTAEGTNITGFSYTTGSVSGSVTAQLFSGISSGSLSFAGANNAGGLNERTASFPVTISVTTGSSGDTTILSDTSTLFRVVGGLAGPQGSPGAPGTDAKSLSLESSTFTFFKAQDGTITPATASITASMQNLSSATASYTIVPSVTLNTGSLLDLSRMELTKDNFGTNSSVRITATGDGGAVSDSINFVLIDEGSGNVQTILTNQAHTFQADHTGSISDFSGGGTSIEVFEGASKLKHTSIDITSATNISGYYPRGSGSFVDLAFTNQNNHGDGFGIALQSADGHQKAYVPTDGGTNGALTGGTLFGGIVVVEVAKSNAAAIKAGNFAAAVTSSNGHKLTRFSCSISTTTSTNDTVRITNVTPGTAGEQGIITGSQINLASDGFGHMANDIPISMSRGRPADQRFANGWYSASISTQNITAGSITAHIDHYNQIQGSSGAKGRYCFSTETFVDGTNANATLSPQITEDFSTATILTAHRNIFDDSTVESELWDKLVVGDRLVYWISPSRWYEYEIKNVNSANNLTPASSTQMGPKYSFELTFVTENVTVPEYTIHKSEESDVYFIHKPRQIALSAPTAMSAASGEIHLTITGSTLNGTAFEHFVTQSFVRSDAGDQPITAQSSRPAITLPGDTSGDPTSYVGSGTTISVFEGASQLQGIDDSGTPTNGQFEVARAGDNITPGADSVDGLNIVIADHSSATETSGSITYTVTGKSLGGDAFTRTINQSFSVSTQGAVGSNAKTVTVGAASQIFVKAQNGTITPSSIVITANGQNLTQAGAFSTTAGTLTSKTENTSGGSATVTSGNFVDGMVVTYTTHGDDGSLTDSVTLKELDEGSGNVTAILDNETHVLPASSDGVVSSYSNSGTKISVFEGATALDYDGSGTTNGHWTVSTSQSPSSTITIGSISDSTNDAVVGNHSSMVNGTDSVTISYAISGKTLNGTSFSFTKTQTLTKAKTGVTGATGPTFDFLTSSFAEVDTSTAIGAGLLMTDEVFGFHNGFDQDATPVLTDFTSFLDASGNFYLGGNASGISSGGDYGYFAWNNTDRSLLISGSAVDIQVDKFYLGRTGQYISGSGGNIEISSSNFHLDSNGDVTMEGTVTATAGEIAGFAISSTKIQKNAGSGYIQMYSDATPNQRFLVTPDGDLSGLSGNLVMMYNYNSGTWGLQGTKNGDNIFQLGSTNQIGGWTFSSTELTKNANTNANYISLDASNSKLQIGGDSKTRVELTAGQLEFYSGSDATPIVELVGNDQLQNGYRSVNGSTVGQTVEGKIQYNPITGHDGTLNFRGLRITGSAFEIGGSGGGSDGNPSFETGIFLEDNTPEALSSQNIIMRPGSMVIDNDNRDLGFTFFVPPSTNAAYIQSSPALRLNTKKTSGGYAGFDSPALYIDHDRPDAEAILVIDDHGSDLGTIHLDIEHNSGSPNESITGISSGVVGMQIDIQAASAQHAEGSVGLFIDQDSSYTDAFTAGIVCSGGQIITSHDVTAYYSDERLKDFKGTIPNALDKVCNLNGYYFTNNDRANEVGYSGKDMQVGVSAQEVKEVLPEIVKKNGLAEQHHPDDEPYMTIDYARLTPLLIEAIKELKEEVNELKNKLEK